MGTKWDPATPIFSEVLSNINFLVNTTAPNLKSTAVALTTASALPPLPVRTTNGWEGKHWLHSISPHNHAISLKNFKSLQNDSETGSIFSQPPLISFKREKNMGNFSVRSSF